MNNTDKIKKLKEEIDSLQREINNCNHVFNKPKYDPETVKEGYGSVYDGAGSDPHWSYAGYRDVEKPRWSKECTICGKKVYTYKQKPIITGTEPDFN
jgi:hypothetical protein